MFVDASAIVAILLNEPEAEELLMKLRSAQSPETSALAKFESALALARAKQRDATAALQVIDALLFQSKAKTVDLTEEIGRMAIEAHGQFGKGRHKAKLNMGDCFAYACAKLHNVPILCKGNDFKLTDIIVA